MRGNPVSQYLFLTPWLPPQSFLSQHSHGWAFSNRDERFVIVRAACSCVFAQFIDLFWITS